MVKLSEILEKVGRVPKRGKNTAQNYSFARESDLVDMLRPMLGRRHLYLHQTVVKHERVEQYETRGGNKMWLTIVSVRCQWIDGDDRSPENQLEPFDFYGYGADTGDKGIYKALTGAEKYALMKTFLVSTGDDPEGDERVDRFADAREAAGRVEVRHGRPQGRRQAAAGGRQQETSGAQTRQLGELIRSAGISSVVEAVPLIERLVEGIKVPLTADGDHAAEFGAYMAKLEPETMGKVLYKLREYVQARPKAAPEGDASAQEQDLTESQEQDATEDLAAEKEAEQLDAALEEDMLAGGYA